LLRFPVFRYYLLVVFLMMRLTQRTSFNKVFVIFSISLNIIFLASLIFVCITFKNKILDKIGYSSTVSVVMFGDSLIEKGDWENILGRSDVRNSGVGGFTTSHLEIILKDRVLKFNPKICYLNGGINDILTGIPYARTKHNINSIIDTLQKHNIDVALQSVLYGSDPKIIPKIDSLNQLYIQIAKAKKIDYINVNNVLSSDKRLIKKYSLDGLHVNKQAYALWAELINKHISKNNF